MSSMTKGGKDVLGSGYAARSAFIYLGQMALWLFEARGRADNSM